MRPRQARVGVDIGGTFTDLVLLTGEGAVAFAKLSSTPQAPERAVLEGIGALLAGGGIAAGEVAEVVHGTTVGSNALLQRTGAATGLITTRGFRDVLEIGRLRTPGMFELDWDKPAPLIRRRHRLEVVERIGADGRVVTPLDEAGLLAAAGALVAAGIASLAVCFLNSYLEPAHERRAGALLAEHFPEFPVSLSIDVLAEAREYERTSTVAVNAYNGRVLWRYDIKGLLKAYNGDELMGTAGTGGNFCVHKGSVYIRDEHRCLRLDAKEGTLRSEFTPPPRPDGKPGKWGYIACVDGLLFGTVANQEHVVTYRYRATTGDMKRLLTEPQK